MINTPSPDLYNRIVNQINYEHRLLLLKRKLLGYAASFFASVVLFIPLVHNFSHDLSNSGLKTIFSLLFSDFQIVISNFNYFAMSLLESIPAASFSLTLLALTVLAFSLGKIFSFWLEFKDLRRLNIS